MMKELRSALGVTQEILSILGILENFPEKLIFRLRRRSAINGAKEETMHFNNSQVKGKETERESIRGKKTLGEVTICYKNCMVSKGTKKKILSLKCYIHHWA